MRAKREDEPHAWVSEDHKDGRIKDTRGKFQEGSEGGTTSGVLPTAQEDYPYQKPLTVLSPSVLRYCNL